MLILSLTLALSLALGGQMPSAPMESRRPHHPAKPVVVPSVPVAPTPTTWMLADASGQRWMSTDYHGLIAHVRAVNARLAYRPAFTLGGYSQYRVRAGSACANGTCR